MKLLGHTDPEMTMRYIDVTSNDVQREFHLARSQPRHLTPQPKVPTISPRTGFDGVIDSLLFAQHAMEMFRRSLPDGPPRRCLDRLNRTLPCHAVQTKNGPSAGSLPYGQKYFTIMKMKIEKNVVVGFCIFLISCSRSNNLLLGRVEARVGQHLVVVTDCYRTSVPPSQTLGPEDFRFMPCRDADVRIQDGLLTVNGRPYGHINRADSILVDHGVVSINP
jgi:hypothetical protein